MMYSNAHRHLNFMQTFKNDLIHLQSTWKDQWQKMDKNTPWKRKSQIKTNHQSIIYSISNGHLFEKAAINFSFIQGKNMPKSALPKHIDIKPHTQYQAMGISTILHPTNPFVPIAHCNLRYFTTLEENPQWWFAAVMDLTPTFGFKEDCIQWHHDCQKACLDAGDHNYEKYKHACDEYYYLKHRKEHRGIGGLWVEYYQNETPEKSYPLIKSIGECFLPSYKQIITQRQNMSYTMLEKEFQNQRRARYLEFNLLYDRGTKFGLEFGSNIEAVFVSMPPHASWNIDEDNEQIKHFEYALKKNFLTPQKWAEEALSY